MTTSQMTFAALVFGIGGIVKGVIGLGLPTISMALLALFMPPVEAVALLIVPSLVTNLWQVKPLATVKPLLLRLWPMQASVFLGTLAGVFAFGAPQGTFGIACLGAALLVYSFYALIGLSISVVPPKEKWLSPLVGAATGLITALTGVFVVPAVPYLQALSLRPAELIQAMGLSFTVSTLALALGLYASSRFSASLVGSSLLMLAPSLMGMYFGQHLRERLSPALFRQCFFGGLLILGVHLLVHALLEWSLQSR